MVWGYQRTEAVTAVISMGSVYVMWRSSRYIVDITVRKQINSPRPQSNEDYH